MGCAPLLHLPLLPLGGVDTADLSGRSPEWGAMAPAHSLGDVPYPGLGPFTYGDELPFILWVHRRALWARADVLKAGASR